MAKTAKATVDHYLETRQASVHPTERGEAVVKLFKAPASWKPVERSARFVMTSQAPDRMGDVVITEGLDTTEFEKNPVGLMFHMSRMFPVGSWSELEKMLTGRPPRMEGTLTLMPEGDDPMCDQLAVHMGRGTIRACSIGFMPMDLELIRDEEGDWNGGFRINEAELYECSPVTVPAHPRALVKDAGGDNAALRRLLEQGIDEFCADLEQLGVSREVYIEAFRHLSPPATAVQVPEGATQIVISSPEAEKGFFARLREAVGLGVKEPETRVDPPLLEEAVRPDQSVVAALMSKAHASRDNLARKGLV